MNPIPATPNDRNRFDWSLLLGYDVFISYKRSSTATLYSRNLRNGLTQKGFKCFLDQEQTEGGVELTPALRRALKRSRLLIVLAESNVVRSAYVPHEIERFRQKRKGRILPINIGSFLDADKPLSPPFDYLQTVTWLNESEQAFGLGTPTEEILSGVRKSFRRLRVASISRFITWAAILMLSTAALVAFLQRQAAIREAAIAIAQAYASDMTLAEQAHEGRNTASVLDILSRYEGRLGGLGSPEFAWLHLWGLYHLDRHLMRHEARVLSTALAPDGKTMATVVGYNEETGGGIIRLWETSSGRERFKIVLPKLTTAGLAAFSPAGDILATPLNHMSTTEIVLWSVATGRQVKAIQVSGPVAFLQFDHDGRSLVGACYQGADAPFQIWDLASGEKRFTDGDPARKDDSLSAVAYTPDGKGIAIAYAENFVRGAFERPRVTIWDTTTRKERAVLMPGADDDDRTAVVGSVAFSPDGAMLATAHGTSLRRGSTTHGPSRVRLWDAKSGQFLASLEGHKMGVHTVAFAPNNRLLASASGNGIDGELSQAILWDLRSRKPVVTLEQSQTGFVEQLVISPDSRVMTMAARDGILTVYDLEARRVHSQLRGHTGSINDMQFTGDSRTLATASDDRSARVWNISVEQNKPDFGEPAVPVACAAASRDGTMIAMGSTNGTLILANAATLRELRRFSDSSEAIEGLAFSSDGKWLAGYGSGRVTVRDVQTGAMRKQLATRKGMIKEIRFDATGRLVTLAVVESPGLSSRTIVERWDVDTERLESGRELNPSSTLLAMNQDGSAIVIRNASGTQPMVEIQDLQSGKTRRVAHPPNWQGEITAAALSGDDTQLAIAENESFTSPRSRILILDAKTLQGELEVLAYTRDIHALAFGPDRDRLASASFRELTMNLSAQFSSNFKMARVGIWNLRKGVESTSFSADSATINLETLRNQSRLYYPNNQAVALKERETLLLAGSETGQLIREATDRAATVHSIGFNPKDEAFVLTMQTLEFSRSNRIKLWDAQTNSLKCVLDELPTAEAWSLAFSPDGATLAVGTEAGNVRLYDTKTGAVTRIIEGHAAPVRSLAFSPDGQLLTPDSAAGAGSPVSAIAPDGKSIAVATDAAAGDVAIVDAKTGKEQIRLRGAKGIRAIALSKQGQVAAGTGDGRVTVWQLPSGQPVARYPRREATEQGAVDAAVLSLQFDPKGERLAIGQANGTVRLWELRQTWIPEFQGHRREVRSLAFSPDGATLGSADTQGRVVLWNVGPSNKAEKQLVMRTGEVWSHVARLSPDGSRIATGGGDKIVMLWDAKSGKRQATLLGHTGPVTEVAFSADGSLLASGSSGESILWDARDGRRLRTFDGGVPLALSANGAKLATTLPDKSVVVWTARSGNRSSRIAGPTSGTKTLAFSADGGTSATVSPEQVRLWDADNGKERVALNGYQQKDLALAAFSPDGKTLATLSDRGIQLWLTFTGRRLLSPSGFNDTPLAIAFSAGGRRVAAATKSEVHVWQAPSEADVQSRLAAGKGR